MKNVLANSFSILIDTCYYLEGVVENR
jgi:hypothetical protein